MPLVLTVVPFLAGMKTSVDQVGWFMSPAPGGETGGSGRMSHAAWPIADAAASPCRCRVTVLLKASLRVTLKFGPFTGPPVDASVNADGGVMAKSGICMTVPL